MTKDTIQISEHDLYPKKNQVSRLNQILSKWKREPLSLNEKIGQISINESQNTIALDWLEKQMDDPEMKFIIEKSIADNPELFIQFNSPEEGWAIFPINLIELMDRKKWKHILIHQGFIFGTDGKFNNEKELDDNGIWGSESKATYIAPIDSLSTAPNFTFDETAKKRRKVTLYINADILIQHRLIWIDPEQFFEHQDPEHTKSDAFYILGGIPAEAIISISDELDQNLF